MSKPTTFGPRACCLIAFSLVAALVPLAAPAGAVALGCIAPAATPGPAIVAPVVVTGVRSYLALNTGCSSLLSLQSSTTPPCTGPGAFPGELCGPVIPAFGTVHCWWTPGIGNIGPVFLFVGFDRNNDGHVLTSSGEAPLVGPIPPGMPYDIVNAGAAGRAIAYPTAVASTFMTTAATNSVGCF